VFGRVLQQLTAVVGQNDYNDALIGRIAKDLLQPTVSKIACIILYLLNDFKIKERTYICILPCIIATIQTELYNVI
jgi:hypothetical protein